MGPPPALADVAGRTPFSARGWAALLVSAVLFGACRTASEPSASEPPASEPPASEPTANEPDTNELTANELTATELTANELTANELTATELTANELTANESTPQEPAPQEQKPQAPAPQDPAPVGAPFPHMSESPDASLAVHGTLQAQFRARTSGDAHDLDAYGLLALDVGTPGQDAWTGHFLARLSLDLDGQGNAASQSTFGSLQDIDGDTAVFDLYEASAQIEHPFDAPLRLRIGRQLDYQTPAPAHFDGLRAESDPIGAAKIVAGAYAGAPVRIYDDTTFDNQIAGAWGEAQPWDGGRVRADWMYVHQEEEGSDHHDDLLGLSLWQRLGQNLVVDGGYTRLDQEDRDLRLRATWNDGEGDWMVQAGWFRLLEVQMDFADEFDPYFETLLEQQPYDQYRLLVSKALGEHVRLDVGGDARRLEDADTEGQFNHDYERAYATGVVTEVTDLDLALSLTADFWNSDDRDVQTWGLDATWEADRAWRLSVGSAYALYKIDIANDTERDDVRVWYTRVRHEMNTAWALDVALEYEDDDFDDYAQLLAGATWRF